MPSQLPTAASIASPHGDEANVWNVPSLLTKVETIRIQPPRGLSYFGFDELWRFRELFVFLTWRDIKVRYNQTAIGASWAVIQPALMMIVFSLFFGRIAKLPTDNIPYPLFVFCGLLPWTFFASAITNAGNSVVGSEKLVTKVYFPRLIIPIAAIGSSVIDVMVASSILGLLLIWYQSSLSISLILAPVCLIMISAAAIGVGSFLAALNVAYRDFRIILPFLIQLWLIATPSVFMQVNQGGIQGMESSSWIPWLLNLNPMVLLVETFRDCVLGHPLDMGRCAIAASISFGLMFFGCLYFRWVEHKFADII